MKYLGVILFSLITALAGIGHAEGHMPWRASMQIFRNGDSRVWSKNERKEYREKEYKIMLIFWVIFTVAALVYVIFFVD